MAFWSRLLGVNGLVTPNGNPEGTVGEGYEPGDPNGLDFVGFDVLSEKRSLPAVQPSPWSGWPGDWGTQWSSASIARAQDRLVDIAWACLDLNSNVLASMPVYHLKDGRIIEPLTWMRNPDPLIYTSWQEFAKQLFWDFMMGEAFVLNMASGSDLYPLRFRVVPPWMVNVQFSNGQRIYTLGGDSEGRGGTDVTDRILHIRYSGTSVDTRGRGPLEAAGARILSIKLLQKYTNTLAETGGIPQYWIGVDRVFRDKKEATDLLEAYIETRQKYAGHPAVLGSGSTLNQAQAMSAKDMALMELSQFNESRVAVLLGTPPFLVGLAGATGSLTYCMDADTEVLTRRGWLRYDAVRVGDTALTLDHDTGLSHWEPILDVNVFDVEDERMLNMQGRGHVSLSTPNHRWPTIDKDTGARRWVTSDTLGPQHRIVLAAPCADLPEHEKYSDEFVEIVAWLMTEGYVNTTPARTWSTIAQSRLRNPVNTARIGHLLTLMFGPARVKGANNPPAERQYTRLFGDTAAWVEDQHARNGMVSFRLNHEATVIFAAEAFEGDWFHKVVSHDFLNSLTASQLRLFVDTCVKADGSVSQGRGDQRVFIQQDGPRVDRFRYACSLLGISTSVYPKAGSDCVTVGVKKRDTYNPFFRNATPPEWIESWSGRVWCPSTPSKTWYARRDGREFFTGNSNVTDTFDFHDRASLRPKARLVMEALSGWAVPGGRSVELNRDDYTRLPLDERMAAYKVAIEMGILTPEEVRVMERYVGESATQALTGGSDG